LVPLARLGLRSIALAVLRVLGAGALRGLLRLLSIAPNIRIFLALPLPPRIALLILAAVLPGLTVALPVGAGAIASALVAMVAMANAGVVTVTLVDVAAMRGIGPIGAMGHVAVSRIFIDATA
jgi:hypothetical protein